MVMEKMWEMNGWHMRKQVGLKIIRLNCQQQHYGKYYERKNEI